MCGIVGIRRFDGQSPDQELLHELAELLRHRGPDGSGYWVSGSTGFGHMRLSIIDLAGSPQPMATVDNRFHLTYNGEIFNYDELRSRLDYPFTTSGDTEVLLAGLTTRGLSWVDELEGQFAFALHDRADDSIVLCRDRLGVLPLYYYLDGTTLLFASEIKALLPALPHQPQVDLDSIDAYLAHRSVPAPYTLFKGIRKLPAGCWLRVSATGEATLHRYWTVPITDGRAIDDATAIDRVDSQLRQAVNAALVADVPVGAYLSGGLDSSLIAALSMEIRAGGGIDTFSAGFGDHKYDELPFARQVSTYLGTRHHEVRLSPSDFQDLWQTLTWHRDAPVSEPADIAVFGLAKLARQHVKVVLSGEGSDEIFAGYPKYRAARWVAAGDALPTALRRRLANAIDHRLPAGLGRLRMPLRASAASGDADRFRSWFSPFTPEERAALLGRPPAAGRLPAPGGRGDLLTRMLETDCGAWLSDNLLERGDRMSMAASLELRPPFLDHHVVEMAFSLPSRVKLRHGDAKWVVKQVARKYLPAEIIERKKSGFRVPLDAWFRGDLADMAYDRLTSSQSFVADVMDRDLVRRMLDRHRTGRSSEEIRIWTLLCLEIWHDVFFAKALTSPHAERA